MRSCSNRNFIKYLQNHEEAGDVGTKSQRNFVFQLGRSYCGHRRINWPTLNMRPLATIHLGRSFNTWQTPMKWWLVISLHLSSRGTCGWRCRFWKTVFSISPLSQDSNCPTLQCKNFSGLNKTEVDPKEAIENFKASVKAYQDKGPLAVHPIFGKVTREQVDNITLSHAAMHLSFVRAKSEWFK